VRLPDVTPQQIVAARKITKFLTGRLDAEVSFLFWFFFSSFAETTINQGSQLSPIPR
jgi:hypothetical protein